MERAGWECKWQVEIDDYATKVLQKHWPDVPKYRDIREFPPPEGVEQVDMICGGFPCQDISYAGKGAGLDGERSGLFYELARVVRLVGPRFVLLENVAALLTRGMGDVLGTLASLGYDAEWECLPAGAFGATFEGDRVFVVATYSHGCQVKRVFDIRKKPRKGRWWVSEPSVGRVVDGVSGTVGNGGGNIEVASLANSVVPQVAEYIGRCIIEGMR